MTRHGKNCTAGMVYTYAERKKDAHQSGYGTDSVRATKDSVRDFDACCLTLQPCRNPVITPEGYLFDKEALLQYIITKKNEISRKMKQYEKEKRQEESELEEVAAAEQRAALRKFEGQETSIISKMPAAAAKSGSSVSGAPSVSNMTSGKARQLPSFWIPSLTPVAKKSSIKKPEKTVPCPMSGKPLRVKDLIDVVFTPVNDPHDKTALITKRNRYMCRVTHDVLGNSVPAAILKPTGDVVTLECVEKLIRKDMRHPVTGQLLQETDILPLQMGGTGFSGTNAQLATKGARPVAQV